MISLSGRPEHAPNVSHQAVDPLKAGAPLAGINVIEISALGPAPCAGMMLADMGAEVTLVQRKSENANAPEFKRQTSTSSGSFVDRGKRSITVDLKNPQGVELVLRLISRADVLVEGHRPGVMERLGLGPSVVLEKNPRLIYARMTGWGQHGPLSQAAGHDPNYVAISGAMHTGGKGRRPSHIPPTVVGDLGGGTMVLVWGILCALIHAQKTGVGQVIDAAITDGVAYLSSLLWVMKERRKGDASPTEKWIDGSAPWNATYECKDGNYITICALEPRFYQELISMLGLADNPCFSQQWDTESWPAGKRLLVDIFLEKTRDEWSALLEASDACFGPVMGLEEAPSHPHNVARGTFLHINGVTQPAPAPRLSTYAPVIGVPPQPGEHSKSILRDAGFSDTEILSLSEEGAI